MRLLSLLLLLVLGLAAATTARSWPSGSMEWTADILPNPQLQPEACGFPKDQPSRLCDPDRVLSQKGRDEANNVIVAIAEEVPTDSCTDKQGYQVAVAIVRRLQPQSSIALAAKRFATGVHDSWGVGYSDCQNGVVIALSIRDRQIYVSTGAQVKDVFTDWLVQQLIQHLRPILRAQDYDRAVVEALAYTRGVLTGEITSGVWKDRAIIALYVIVIAAVLYFTGRRALRRKKQYADCRRKLTRIEQARAESLAGQFQETMCSICLEDLPPLPGKPEVVDDPEATGHRAEAATEVAAEAEAVPGPEPSPEQPEPQPAEASQPVAVRLLRCGHRFCGPCIDDWLKHQPGNLRRSCPVCREPLDGRGRDAPPAPRPGQFPGDEDEDDESKHDPTEGEGGSGSSPDKGNLRARNRAAPEEPRAPPAYDADAEMLMFRLLRLRAQYPSFVTREMVNTWSSAPMGTSFAQHPTFTARNPAANSASSHSSGGRSSSWGGGSSFGGGGGGGGW